MSRFSPPLTTVLALLALGCSTTPRPAMRNDAWYAVPPDRAFDAALATLEAMGESIADTNRDRFTALTGWKELSTSAGSGTRRRIGLSIHASAMPGAGSESREGSVVHFDLAVQKRTPPVQMLNTTPDPVRLDDTTRGGYSGIESWDDVPFPEAHRPSRKLIEELFAELDANLAAGS